MKPLSFIIVGSGWRSLFFARIARQFPEQFELKYMLCCSEEKAQELKEKYGLPSTTSEELCDEAKPDFVVVAIRSPYSFAYIKKWSDKGYPILTETPAAGTLEDLKELWAMVQAGAKIQVAEQYHRYPLMAAGLKAIAEGKLGEPHMVHLSLAHGYHGVSMIRRMLQPENPMDLKLEYVTGMPYKHTVTETDSRYGAITDGSVADYTRIVNVLQFTNGKTAYYDWCGVQYHSFIRARHLSVKGQDGEWNDTMLRYVDENHLPVAEEVKAYLNSRYACLNTEDLLRQSREWNPFIVMDNGQDEYAIGSMMFDMRDYILNGTEVYPMAEALEDAYVSMLMQQATKQPVEKLVPERMSWEN